jgi:hypothetical protein
VVFLDFSIKQPALVELSLINAIGQVVLSSQSQVSGQVHQSLNINEIPAGVYLVRVQAGNQVLTRRLVVRG